MTTQQDALNWLNAQVGQHLDYDRQFGQQCVDFFNYYYQFLTGESPYSVGYSVPSAYMIWGVANDHFAKLPDSNNLTPQPGDIAIYGTAWGGGNGHVEAVASTDAGGCTFIGENEHNNPNEGVVRVYRTFSQMRGLLGVLRPNWQADAPPAPPAPKFTVTETYDPGKQIRLNKQPTNLWGMNYDFDYMTGHPVEVHNQGEIWTVTNKVHHEDGMDYYRRDGQVDGFNVADCDDYTPPPPAPYVPPAAPVAVKKAEMYTLVTTLPYFGTSGDVALDRNAISTIQPGKYYVWSKEGTNNNYWELSTSNSKNEHMWINITDNRVAPKLDTARLDPPEMDKPTSEAGLTPIPENVDPATMNWRGSVDLRYAGMYVFWNHNREHDETATTVDIYDLDTGQLKKSTANGTYAQFSGKVKWTDGNWYGRMKDRDDSFHWYAAHIEDLYPYNEVYGTHTSLQERQALHTLSTIDRLEMGLAKIKTIGANIWDVVRPKGKK